MRTSFNKMSTEMKKKNLIYKLTQLEEAFADLASMWAEDDTDMCEDSLGVNYPFKTSFDELSVEVSEWAEDARIITRTNKS